MSIQRMVCTLALGVSLALEGPHQAQRGARELVQLGVVLVLVQVVAAPADEQPAVVLRHATRRDGVRQLGHRDLARISPDVLFALLPFALFPPPHAASKLISVTTVNAAPARFIQF